MGESRILFSNSNRCFSFEQFGRGEVEAAEIGGAAELTVDVVEDDEDDEADHDEGDDEGPGGDRHQGLGAAGGDGNPWTEKDRGHFTYHKVFQHYSIPVKQRFVCRRAPSNNINTPQVKLAVGEFPVERGEDGDTGPEDTVPAEAGPRGQAPSLPEGEVKPEHGPLIMSISSDYAP